MSAFNDFEGVVFAEPEPVQTLAQLEHDARFGREMLQRLDALMQSHREGHAVTYADLQLVRGE